jgi:isoleucyl-tRNA synthetase
MLGNLNEFNEADLLDLNQCAEIDLWAINQAKQLQAEVVDLYDSYQLHLVYQKILHFCSQDMGAFYLDVIKDRLYTCKDKGDARKSAQTAMHHILNALVRLMAPILTFTADEVRLSMRQDKHILFNQWYEFPAEVADKKVNAERWILIANIRQAVAKQLEQLRVAGSIGSSLDAEVNLFLPEKAMQMLSSINDELRFVLITSEAKINDWSDRADAKEIELSDGSKIAVTVRKADGEKCARCWHVRADVGSDKNHPLICHRCVENVDGLGEIRSFA